ncbi:HAD-IIB family hydrolase [Nonomuraea maheshkhaliensis]|uniref:HAD-IIB family hydrolase n=1 Tax=Nonomuraea maheshkhaliensis TaxID=419590 RepID=A0ABN2FN41_9ACTN
MNLIRALAVDLDGTLTTGGVLSETAMRAIDEQRRRGLRAVLVTGRIMAELEADFPGLPGRFDAVVTENGCVLHAGPVTRELADPVDTALEHELRRSQVPLRRGRVLLACDDWAGGLAYDAIARLGLDVQIVHNRGHLMLLPPGVTKATGLTHVLDEFGLSPHNAVGAGDAENDHSLLECCEYGVAVANAVPGLARRADLVLEEFNGTGIAALLKGPLLSGGLRLPVPRRRLLLGTTPAGTPVHLPAAQTNLLISGGSGLGKSYLIGLLAEQLTVHGYSVLVIDPEGDHAGLGDLPDTLIAGDGHALPDPATLLDLAVRPRGAVVLDLSRMPPPARDRYLGALAAPLRALRAARGLPHWVLIDEAHQSAAAPANPIHPADGEYGYCLATYQPHLLTRESHARMEWRIRLIAGGRCAVHGPDTDVPVIVPAARRTFHQRHLRKYTETTLSAERGFHFRTDAGRTGVIALNLRQFTAELGRCPPAVLRHHAAGGDFSRWIRDVHAAHDLAAEVRSIEEVLAADGDADLARARLTDIVHSHYLTSSAPADPVAPIG